MSAVKESPTGCHFGFSLSFAIVVTSGKLWIEAFGLDLSPKFPPALRGVLGVKSLALGGHLVLSPSPQEFHRG